MRPSFHKREDDVVKKVESKVSSVVENKIKSEVDSRVKSELDSRVRSEVDKILKEKDEKEKSQKAEKLKAAVDTAKAIKGVGGGVGGVGGAGAVVGDDILCPTCHTGHVHKIETSKNGLSVKCTGPGCGKEYVLVDKTSDYQCRTCGAPIKKPADPSTIESCPFCAGKKAIKYDWSKVWNVTRK